MRKIDAIVAKVQFARAMRLERASKEASCAFEIESLKKKIQLKRHVLREFQLKRKTADEEVRAAVSCYRDNMHILAPSQRDRYASDGASSNFDLYLAFPRVRRQMLCVDSSLPPSSEAGDLPQAIYSPVPSFQNRGCEMTPSSQRSARFGERLDPDYEFPYDRPQSPPPLDQDHGRLALAYELLEKPDALEVPDALQMPDALERPAGDENEASLPSVTEEWSSPPAIANK